MNVPSPMLIVDDDADDRELVRRLLSEAFPAAELVDIDGASAFSRILAGDPPALVLTELDLSWITAPELVRTLRDTFGDVPIVLFSRAENESLAIAALQAGADGFVSKTSRGFLDLPDAAREAIFRSRRRRQRTAGDGPYRNIVQALPVGVFTATNDGQILDVNPAFASILGFDSADAAAGHLVSELFADTGDAERWEAQIHDAHAGAQVEAALRRRDGETIWVRLSTWSSRQGAADQRYLHGVVEDISQEKRAQQELVRRNTVLVQSCTELENFASVVSHDLREPLHLVERYTTMLAERYGSKLDAKAGEYMEQIVHGATRLRGMIDAILELSRVETRGGTFKPVDFEGVLAETMSTLEETVARTSATITHDLLPTLAADETQMVQLFQNLLGNALKFRNETDPQIHIAAEQRPGEWLFSVRDNGIGIEPGEASRIFEIFQRLHTHEEYPGMGIGLTLCQKIVQRHGGRIWFESEPGRGTTFFFTIPEHVGQWP